MTPRIVAISAAITLLILGTVGIILPDVFARAFGAQFDATATALVRLASAAYLGYAVLAWLVRDLTDMAVWRAVAGANAVSWALSAVVLAVAIGSGLGDARAWALVALQVVFAIGWSMTYLRPPVALAQAR